MSVTCSAERSLPCTPEVAFALVTDVDRFPAFFTGFGPIPAVRGIRLHSELAVGSQRRVHNADGTVLSERITAHDPPVRHAYTLSGFRPPLAWLVEKGEANWTFTGHEFGSRVRWDYEFTLARPWLWPVAALLLKVFMARAMHRCLKNMARSLAAPDAAPAGRT
ncbi:MAG TPA: SRPBCC family protein [Arenimonas sp.]|nr:SRPBCC family protein [Arenimonas sp.]